MIDRRKVDNERIHRDWCTLAIGDSSSFFWRYEEIVGISETWEWIREIGEMGRIEGKWEEWENNGIVLGW